MLVTFGDRQIRLTNAMTEDAASSPLFAPGSVLSWTPTSIYLNLSNTCEQCVGLDLTHPGESISLNVAAVPEPSTWALVVAGVAWLAWRRHEVA